MLLRPKVKRDRRKFVHKRVSQSVLSEIRRLDVGLAIVAAFHPNMRKLCGRVHREFGLVLLSTCGTHDAPELPFTEAEAANQVAACAVALQAEDAEGWLTIAKRAQWMGVAFELQPSARAGGFGVGLEKASARNS